MFVLVCACVFFGLSGIQRQTFDLPFGLPSIFIITFVNLNIFAFYLNCYLANKEPFFPQKKLSAKAIMFYSFDLTIFLGKLVRLVTTCPHFPLIYPRISCVFNFLDHLRNKQLLSISLLWCSGLSSLYSGNFKIF